ncbi:hypothetical protein Ahy_A07g032754 [Arachis hypogaea]|uniref:Uncharacterized protein n=1 Tax=Arachis hypogaea TaxID=3818 RepID=A0A445C7Q3_ARAHY|nr:hypothetical protein Ahy_A07g032754 [Arachis hypogaea]
MASLSPSMERRDEDILASVHLADEVKLYDGADHRVGSVEGKGFAGMESDEYELHEDETKHDHLGEADGNNGMWLNWKTIWTVSIDFANLSKKEVCWFNFTDVNITFEFYQAYAKHHGFGGRRSKSEKYRQVRIRQEFVCHRQGFRSVKFYLILNRQKRPRAETQCGCPARMHVSMDDESEHWYVAHVSNEHNHPVLELKFSSMLPSHRRMNEADIEQMNDMHKGDIAGGLDAKSCLRYLRECKANDPALYYKEVVDREGLLQYLFWCDGTSQIDCQVFRDVVAFDATYKKNVYLSPLVVFSGVNHHNQTIVFAAVLVANEKEDTYVWLLQQLQTAMNGKAPMSIITDGNMQMKSAIKQVFPEAHHRLCAWHLLQNATSNIEKPNFTRMFKDCMLGDYEEVEADFECAKGDPVMTTNLKQLERCVAENNTRAIFYLFVPILDRTCAMRVVDSKDSSSYFIHTVSRYGTSGKDWKVCKIGCCSTVKFQFARDIVMLMLKHFKNEDAADNSFSPEGPSNEGSRALA